MRRWLLIVGFSLVYLARLSAAAGELLEYNLVRSFPQDELKAFFKKQHIPNVVLPVNQGINIYEVVYTSTYVDGSTVKASGLLYLPMIEGRPMPVMIYNHGTEICRDRSCSFTGEQSICLAFATDQYIVICPDYLGLGKGDKSQLYLHANTEAQASVDMLLAVQKLLPLLGAKGNRQLFVSGYSQGGHASMATSRLLQQKYSEQLPVTASAPMSGPYDLENTVFQARTKKSLYPGFLFLMLQSYFISTNNPSGWKLMLNPPYDTLIPPLLDANHSIQQIDDLLPDTVFKIVNPKYYAQFESQPDSGFRKYLRDNNVFDWKPEMPMMLSYCNHDEEVTFRNSITAYQTMRNNGSKTVHLWRAGRKFGHVNCALFAVVYTKMYFDSFRVGHPGRHGPLFKRLLLTIGKLTVKGT